MGEVRIVSASAGSGKTTRLARELSEAVASGVQPERIVATTFTRKAAAELEARVRTALVAAGHVEKAQRLAAARIGTINAVCGAFVADYAFELGISPDVRVLDEEGSARALAQALAQTLSSAAATAWLDELEDLRGRMPELDWKDAVTKIQALARANGLGDADLVRCEERSTHELLSVLGPAAADGETLDGAFRSEAERFVKRVRNDGELTQATRKVLERVQKVLGRFRHGSLPTWADWCGLANDDVGKRERYVFEPLKRAAAAHDVHPRMRHDLARTITLCFELARRSLASYAEHKRALGAIDFVDQEVEMLRLLDRSDVVARIREEVELVLVDEFQDTSPLQLAIFLKLSQLVPRSVWVGDQKQAIYGFRGADPSLMEEAMRRILAGKEPETLRSSWRSRPPLVDATSRFFAAAFGSQGIPASRVTLTAGDGSPDRTALGPIFERWVLRSGKAEEHAIALANVVAQALVDTTVHVRDRVDSSVRRARPGDYAILCRTNQTCAKVAAALRALGIRALLALPQLGDSYEQRLVLSGLRLWVDDRDSLAKAELGLLLEHPGDEDAWLARILTEGQEYARSFDDLPAVVAIAAARERSPHLGPVGALDAALEALEVRERCLEWGDAADRLANVEGMRARAVRYAAGCSQAGSAATPAGLLAHFFDGEDPENAPVPPDAEDAVVVSTWHRAKGLEWPITVLFELGPRTTPPVFDACVEPRPGGIDLDAPLAERWICFWPNPYRGGTKKTRLYAALQSHPIKVRREDERRREEMRLAYVGWTRARDRVVFAATDDALPTSVLGFPAVPGVAPIGEPKPDGSWPELLGRLSTKAMVRVGEPITAEPAFRTPASGYVASGARAHPPAFVLPSALGKSGAARAHAAASSIRIGEHLAISGRPDMEHLGNALHAFFAADVEGLTRSERLEIAQGLLERWRVATALPAESAVAAGDALRAWVDRTWPGAAWRRELPLRLRNEDGGVVVGTADLVLETAAGSVIVDHKSYPGSLAEAVERATGHAPQLEAYERLVVAATGRPTVARCVHMPMVGIVVLLT